MIKSAAQRASVAFSRLFKFDVIKAEAYAEVARTAARVTTAASMRKAPYWRARTSLYTRARSDTNWYILHCGTLVLQVHQAQ